MPKWHLFRPSPLSSRARALSRFVNMTCSDISAHDDVARRGSDLDVAAFRLDGEEDDWASLRCGALHHGTHQHACVDWGERGRWAVGDCPFFIYMHCMFCECAIPFALRYSAHMAPLPHALLALEADASKGDTVRWGPNRQGVVSTGPMHALKHL